MESLGKLVFEYVGPTEYFPPCELRRYITDGFNIQINYMGGSDYVIIKIFKIESEITAYERT